MIRLRRSRKFEQKNISLSNKINDAYEKLLAAADVLSEITGLIEDDGLDDGLVDVAYDLYLETRKLADSVSDELRSLL